MISNDDKMMREQAVTRLQTHLCSIRNLAGWSTTDLAERLGVTKQTIWNLENKNTKMTMVQYIAIRAIIDAEIAAHPEKETLKKTVELFLDTEIPDEEQERVDDMSDFFTHTSSAPEETLEKLFNVMWNDAITTGEAVFKATKEVVEDVADDIPKWMDNIMNAFNQTKTAAHDVVHDVADAVEQAAANAKAAKAEAEACGDCDDAKDDDAPDAACEPAPADEADDICADACADANMADDAESNDNDKEEL